MTPEIPTPPASDVPPQSIPPAPNITTPHEPIPPAPNITTPHEPDFVPTTEAGVSEPITQRLVHAKHDTTNLEHMRKYLLNFPVRVIQETLTRTTQLAKTMTSYPLVRHVKARFSWLNRFRINEKVSTDTIFANVAGLRGETCAQVFYGMTSHMINVYGMKRESEFPDIYGDFLRHEGHLLWMINLFGYLKHRPNGKLICDSSYPQIEISQKNSDVEVDWTDFYPDAEEELPPNMPTPYGPKARITCYVDSDHAHCRLTRRSTTGILLFVNNMPVRWVSRQQKTVETSTYGSELVAARIATDLIIEVRYALRMLGINIEQTSTMYGDNLSVVLNTTIPSSVLKKKHNAIAYHRVREAAASRIL